MHKPMELVACMDGPRHDWMVGSSSSMATGVLSQGGRGHLLGQTSLHQEPTVNNTKSKQQLSHDSTLHTQLFTSATSLGLATYICNRSHL